MTRTRMTGARRSRHPGAWLIGMLLLPVVPAHAQPAPPRILVMPLEGARDPRIYWLTEGASVLLVEDLNALGASAITRDERLRAFERLQVPAVASLSRATIIRIGQLLGASQLVTGSLGLSGDTLEMRVRSIRLDAGRLEEEIVERGTLTDVTATAERVARRLLPASTVPLGQIARTPPSLAAFENYVKGLMAEAPGMRATYLAAALKIAPHYDDARLALWSLHHEQGDHEAAFTAAQAVPESSPASVRARFHASVSLIESKRYDDAFKALRALLDRSPDASVFNNLGVVQVRRGGTPEAGRATYYFNQAAEKDPDNPDYDFNLGYAYWLERDVQASIYWLRECVRRNPADGDAHFVLGAALRAAGNSSEALRENELARQLSSRYVEWERRPPSSHDGVPRGLERLRSAPDLPGAARLDSVLVASEQREQREQAMFHLERGRRLFEQESDREAIDELRRALFLSPYEAPAHLLLGRIYLRTGRLRDAIDALKISIWSAETAAAHLALGEALLQSRDAAGARAEAARALTIEPESTGARALLDRIAATGPR